MLFVEKDDTPRHEYHQDSQESVYSLQQSALYSKMSPVLSVPLFQLRYWEVLIDDFSSILWNAVILLSSTQVALLSTPFLEKFFRVNSLLAQVDKLGHLSPISHVCECTADSFLE